MPSRVQLQRFQKTVWAYYAQNRRDFPWRETRDPYLILVSEIMLQQTQAPRVIAKYDSFIKRFPSLASLAKAKTTSVLKEWQGLGYNRRGLALKRAAEEIMKNHNGKVPSDYNALINLPGVGPATAGDILAFAWNKPSVVIETNIRSVFIHEFFPESSSVPDTEILPLITATLDQKNPRDWYYALMDYGAMLKKTLPNPSRRSRHFTVQSPFKGSNRELRSKILKYLLAYPQQSSTTIAQSLEAEPQSIIRNLQTMIKEGLVIAISKNRSLLYRIA